MHNAINSQNHYARVFFISLTSNKQLLISVSFGLLWRIVSLAIMLHLLFLYTHGKKHGKIDYPIQVVVRCTALNDQ